MPKEMWRTNELVTPPGQTHLGTRSSRWSGADPGSMNSVSHGDTGMDARDTEILAQRCALMILVIPSFISASPKFNRYDSFSPVNFK